LRLHYTALAREAGQRDYAADLFLVLAPRYSARSWG